MGGVCCNLSTGRLEGCEFEASLGCTLRFYLNKDNLRNELVGIKQDSIILAKGQTLEECE